ncbi:hypothetical protein LY76DRAFT_156845 [Colletotrichum caudatum]|nr:hypothetical protein LY76DRAFT_156845 [Colletotrichum caudatum]
MRGEGNKVSHGRAHVTTRMTRTTNPESAATSSPPPPPPPPPPKSERISPTTIDHSESGETRSAAGRRRASTIGIVFRFLLFSNAVRAHQDTRTFRPEPSIPSAGWFRGTPNRRHTHQPCIHHVQGLRRQPKGQKGAC